MSAPAPLSAEALQQQVADLERRLRGQQQLMERALTTQSKALLAEKARARVRSPATSTALGDARGVCARLGTRRGSAATAGGCRRAELLAAWREPRRAGPPLTARQATPGRAPGRRQPQRGRCPAPSARLGPYGCHATATADPRAPFLRLPGYSDIPRVPQHGTLSFERPAAAHPRQRAASTRGARRNAHAQAQTVTVLKQAEDRITQLLTEKFDLEAELRRVRDSLNTAGASAVVQARAQDRRRRLPTPFTDRCTPAASQLGPARPRAPAPG